MIIDTASLIELASSPYSLLALTILSFSESAFFIIPPEVLMIPMALANPAGALWYGLVTTISSVFGAALGYGIGKKGGKPVLHKFFAKNHIEAVRMLFHKYDTKAIFVSAFTPIPYKVFTIAAGVFDLNFQRFIIASIIGRGARYMLIAGSIAIFGESIRYFLEHQFDKVVAAGTIILIVTFMVYKFGLPYLERKYLKFSVVDRIKSLLS